MSLNKKIITRIGESVDNGEYLNELATLNVYDHMQATVYYENGLPDVDSHFGDKGYMKSGYLCNLAASVNVISILFMKYERDNVVDFGIVAINRKNILRYELSNSTNLTIVKRNATSHKTKYALSRGFGAIGALGGIVSDQFVNVDTENVNGTKFKLYYEDNNKNEKFITLYSSEENKHKTILFLNTYYKKELPNAAKTPADNSSTCFIATACYRDIFCSEVVFFRWYRDNKLSNFYFGRLFIKVYYKTSPLIYSFLFNNTFYSKKIKYILDRIYLSLSKTNK